MVSVRFIGNSVVISESSNQLLVNITESQKTHVQDMFFKEAPFEEYVSYLTPKDAGINYVDNVEIEGELKTAYTTKKDEFYNKYKLYEKDGLVYIQNFDTYNVPQSILDNLDNKPNLIPFYKRCQSAYASGIAKDISDFVIKFNVEILPNGCLILYRRVRSPYWLTDFTTKVKSWKKSLFSYGLSRDKKLIKLPYTEHGFDYPSLSNDNIYTSDYDKNIVINIGVPYRLPIEECDFSRSTCSTGLHWAATSLATYGGTEIKGIVAPECIVSVPYKGGESKLRCFDSLPLHIDHDVNKYTELYDEYLKEYYSTDKLDSAEFIRQQNIKMYQDYLSNNNVVNDNSTFEEDDLEFEEEK